MRTKKIAKVLLITLITFMVSIFAFIACGEQPPIIDPSPTPPNVVFEFNQTHFDLIEGGAPGALTLTMQNITGTPEWQNSNSSTVDMVAISGPLSRHLIPLTEGAATITATLGGHTATATVNVFEALEQPSLIINNPNINLLVGRTQTITVTTNLSQNMVRFSTRDASVATVNEISGQVTAVGTGITNIEVRAGAMMALASVTVAEPLITINTPNSSLFEGQSLNLDFTANPDWAGHVTWATDNADLVTISAGTTTTTGSISVTAQNLNSAITNPIARISATFNGETDFVYITVVSADSAIYTIELSNYDLEFILGSAAADVTAVVTRYVFDTILGVAVPSIVPTPTIVWTIEDTDPVGVVSVDNGLITPLVPGTATVRATFTSGGFTVYSDITVVVIDDIPDSAVTIETPEDLMRFMGNPNLGGYLVNDIDMSSVTLPTTTAWQTGEFNGVWEGNGFTVHGLVLNRFFNRVGPDGVIRNIHFIVERSGNGAEVSLFADIGAMNNFAGTMENVRIDVTYGPSPANRNFNAILGIANDGGTVRNVIVNKSTVSGGLDNPRGLFVQGAGTGIVENVSISSPATIAPGFLFGATQRAMTETGTGMLNAANFPHPIWNNQIWYVSQGNVPVLINDGNRGLHTMTIDQTGPIEMFVGDQRGLSVSFSGIGVTAAMRDLTWGVSSGTAVSISDSGDVTALSTGTATITATSATASVLTGSPIVATIIVNVGAATTVEITNASDFDGQNVEIGTTGTLTTVANRGTVTFNQSGTGSVTINNAGEFTAVTAGTVTITATTTYFASTATDSITITVLPLATMSFSESNINLEVGGSVNLENLLTSNRQGLGLLWTVTSGTTNVDLATVGGGSGVIALADFPNLVTRTATVRVTAVRVVNGVQTYCGYATINITIMPTASLAAGAYASIVESNPDRIFSVSVTTNRPTVGFSFVSGGAYIYDFDQEAILTGTGNNLTVTFNFRVNASVADGSNIVIRAMHTENNTLIHDFNIQVGQVLANIEIANATRMLDHDDTYQLALGVNTTVDPSNITFSSNNPLVTVSANGLVTVAATGLDRTQDIIVTITATGDGVTTTATLTIRWVAATVNADGIDYNGQQFLLTAGQTISPFGAVSTNKGGINWVSSNPNIATVVDGVVTAVTSGIATIRVESLLDPSVFVYIEVVVVVVNITNASAAEGALQNVGDSFALDIEFTIGDTLVWTYDSNFVSVNQTTRIITVLSFDGATYTVITVTSTLLPTVSASITISNYWQGWTRITTSAQLAAWMYTGSADTNAYLAANIDLNNQSFDVMGPRQLTRVLDGRGHSVINFTFSRFFNGVSATGAFRNIHIIATHNSPGRGGVFGAGAGQAFAGTLLNVRMDLRLVGNTDHRETISYSSAATATFTNTIFVMTPTVSLTNAVPTIFTIGSATFTNAHFHYVTGDGITVALRAPHGATNRTMAWLSSASNWTGVNALPNVWVVENGEVPTLTHGFPVTLSLSRTDFTLFIGEGAQTIIATTNRGGVEWASSNAGVASVYNGVVTAVAVGTTIITATSTVDSNVTVSLIVTVEEPVVGARELDFVINQGTAGAASNWFSSINRRTTAIGATGLVNTNLNVRAHPIVIGATASDITLSYTAVGGTNGSVANLTVGTPEAGAGNGPGSGGTRFPISFTPSSVGLVRITVAGLDATANFYLEILASAPAGGFIVGGAGFITSAATNNDFMLANDIDMGYQLFGNAAIGRHYGRINGHGYRVKNLGTTAFGGNHQGFVTRPGPNMIWENIHFYNIAINLAGAGHSGIINEAHGADGFTIRNNIFEGTFAGTGPANGFLIGTSHAGATRIVENNLFLLTAGGAVSTGPRIIAGRFLAADAISYTFALNLTGATFSYAVPANSGFRTAAQLQTASTFSTWDIGIWNIVDGAFPSLHNAFTR